MIDTGPDFRQQMLRAKVSKLDAVVFTHGHKDHTAGFDDIRAYNYMQQKDMEVFVDEQTEAVLRKDFDYAFAKIRYPGVPSANLNRITNEPFMVGNTLLTPISVLHYKLPVFGFRVKDFTYITDANFISQQEKDKIKGSKIVVINALRKAKHISHFTLDEAIALAKELGAEKTYFTHISHQLGKHDEVSKELPKGIFLAFDGMRLTMD